MKLIKCITSPVPFQCGRSKARTSTPGERRFQRRNSLVVRAVADADEQRPLVEPDRIAALGEGRCLELACHRYPRRFERRDHRRRLAAAPFLPGSQEYRAGSSYENRVVHVDGVGVPGIVA